MKRIAVWVCGLAMVLAAGTNAFAADEPSFGVQAGVNLGGASLSGPDVSGIDTSMKVGFIGGVNAMLPVSPMVSIGVEPSYAQKSFKISAGSFHETEQISFLQVPVVAHIMLGDMAAATRFYVVVGPSVGFRLSAKSTDSTDFSGDHDIKDDIKSVDFSVVGGAGAMFGQIGVEARYDLGLTDLNKDKGLGDLTYKSRAITFLVRWSSR